jgi:PPOX class probable F420-dependent enzyme
MAEVWPWHARARHRDASISGRRAAASNSVLYLANAKYLLLESQHTDGTLIGTPMWFAVIDDTIFLRAPPDAAAVRSVHRRPVITVAACTMLGAPFGDYIECSARIVPRETEAEAEAEAALHRSYGTVRRLLSRLARNDAVYLEATPLSVATPTPEVVSLPASDSVVRNIRGGDVPGDAA